MTVDFVLKMNTKKKIDIINDLLEE